MTLQGKELKKSFEDVSQVVKKLTVEIPKEVVEKKREESFLKLQKKAKVQGFRPGKAPMSIIKTRFGESVIEQLEEDLVKEGYFEAVKETDIKAIAIKKIEDGKYTEGQDFQFSALIEVLPEFAPEGYEGIEISEKNQDVTDDEVTAEIDKMRQSQAVYKPVERESTLEDLLEIGFKAFDGDEAIEDQEDSTYLLSETPALGEEFDEHLKEKKAGDELDFEVTYPEDFKVDQVKGKKIRYEIRVKSVKEKMLPEADDDFARSIPEVESLEDLKGKIGEQLRSFKEQEEKKSQENQVIEALVEKNDIEVPETLVDEEIMRMIRDTESRLKNQGVQFDFSQIDGMQLRERYRESAIRTVKSALILAEIGKKEKIEITDQELEDEMNTMSENFNISFEKVASYYEDENAKQVLKNSLLERKVMEFLLKSGVKVAEKEDRGKDTEEAKKEN